MKIKTKLLYMLLIVDQFHMASMMYSEISLTQHFDNTEYLYSLTNLTISTSYFLYDIVSYNLTNFLLKWV